MPSAKRKRVDDHHRHRHRHRHDKRERERGHERGHEHEHEREREHDEHEHEHEQSFIRRERNRLHAKVSRERKKQHIAYMQRTIDYLRTSLKASVPEETFEQIMREAPEPTLVATVTAYASSRTKEETERKKPLSRKEPTPFVNKLRAMLDNESLEHAVRWSKTGDSIEFVAAELAPLLHNYFRSEDVATFQRQLNYHEFIRVSSEADDGTLLRYQHAEFTRDRPETMVKIVRRNKRARDRANETVEKDCGNAPARHCVNRMQLQLDQLQSQFEHLRDTWLSFTPAPPPPMALPPMDATPANTLSSFASSALPPSDLDIALTSTYAAASANPQGIAVDSEYLDCLL